MLTLDLNEDGWYDNIHFEFLFVRRRSNFVARMSIVISNLKLIETEYNKYLQCYSPKR